MTKKVKKVVLKIMRDKAKERLTELKFLPKGVFRMVRGLRVAYEELEALRYMRETDGILCLTK